MRVSDATWHTYIYTHTHPRGLASCFPFHIHMCTLCVLCVVDTHARTYACVRRKWFYIRWIHMRFHGGNRVLFWRAWNVCVCVCCLSVCMQEGMWKGSGEKDGGAGRRRLRAKVTHNHRNCDIIECAILSFTPQPANECSNPNNTKERTFKQHSRDMNTCYRICRIFISITSYFVQIQITYI